MNVRDDLLLDLLASEAIVDSRTYEVLSAEEVEELKKVCLSIHAQSVALNAPIGGTSDVLETHCYVATTENSFESSKRCYYSG